LTATLYLVEIYQRKNGVYSSRVDRIYIGRFEQKTGPNLLSELFPTAIVFQTPFKVKPVMPHWLY